MNDSGERPAHGWREGCLTCVPLQRGAVFIGLTYALFFVFLLLQHQSVFLHYDDWGYAVMALARNKLQGEYEGQDFTLAHLVAFLANEYMAWTGRVTPHFLHILAQKVGLDFVRFVNSAAAASVVFLSFLLARDPGASPARTYLLALIPVLLFLAMPFRALIGGFYFFSASSAHFWGVPFFLAASLLARPAARLPAFSVLLLSFSASFSEPMSFAAMAYATTFALLGHDRNARAIVRAAIRSSPIFVVSAVTLFSPGNAARFIHVGGYGDLGIEGILIQNVEWVAAQLFWPRPFGPFGIGINVFSMFMILGALLMLLGLWFDAPRHERTAPRALAGRTYAAIALLLVVSFLVSIPFVQWLAVAGLAVPTSFSLLLFRTASASPAGRSIVCIHASSLAGLLPILVAPQLQNTYFQTFLALGFAPVAYAIAGQGPMRVRHAAIAAILILGGLSVKSAAEVFDGYRSNRIVYEINDAQLRVRSFMQGRGMAPDGAVMLFKLKNRSFARFPPYEKRYVERWMKKYYRLAPDTEFTWR